MPGSDLRNLLAHQPAHSLLLIVIVIVISRFLKRYSKDKRTRAPAYSRALRRIKGGFQGGSREAQVRFPEYQLSQLRVVSRSLSCSAAAALDHAFVTNRLDHCSSILVGLPLVLTARLDRVLRCAARLIGRIPKCGYATLAPNCSARIYRI